MKATVKESHVFKPITVELVIESEVELAWLKAISNASIKSVTDVDETNEIILKPFSDIEISKAALEVYNTMKAL